MSLAFCGLAVEPAIEFCQNWNIDHSESVAIWVSGFTNIRPRCSPINVQKWRAGSMRNHTEPNQCLRELVQFESDGGRAEYLEQERETMRIEPEKPTGDCAVVAVVHGSFLPPTGHSYRTIARELSGGIQDWMHNERRMGETYLEYTARLVKQWLRPLGRNPLHGTPTHAIAQHLIGYKGYDLIFPNQEGLWHCICDEECTYVLDLRVLADHTISVHQRVAYTTLLFKPDEVVVGNVYRLDAERTRKCKALRRYHDDLERWLTQTCRSGSGPKLGDYLKIEPRQPF